MDFLSKKSVLKLLHISCMTSNTKVENDVIESVVKLEDVFKEFRKNETSVRGFKRKVAEMVPSAYDSVSDSNESDSASRKKCVQNVVLQSMIEFSGSNETQRKDIVSNRKKIDLELFQEYKNHFGDLRVPQKFTVPYEASWSHLFHGVNLGAVVKSIRVSLKANKMDYCEVELSELMDMGFIPDANEDKRQRVLLAFQLFVAKYGHADVPRRFSIDKNDQNWPKEVRGLNLGTILDSIRNNGMHREIRQQLIDIGVDLTAQKITLTIEQVYNTLVIYKELHGTTDIEHNFDVPESSDFPKYAWGYALGKCVYMIINCGHHSQFSKQWDSLGIEIKHKVVKSAKDITIDGICEAIECYKTVHSNVNIKENFVVPPDASFPPHLHGIRLGKIVYHMRNKGSYVQHKDRLAQLDIFVAKRAVYVEQLVGMIH